MDGWMDGMDGMDGWMDGWMDRWTDGISGWRNDLTLMSFQGECHFGFGA